MVYRLFFVRPERLQRQVEEQRDKCASRVGRYVAGIIAAAKFHVPLKIFDSDSGQRRHPPLMKANAGVSSCQQACRCRSSMMQLVSAPNIMACTHLSAPFEQFEVRTASGGTGASVSQAMAKATTPVSIQAGTHSSHLLFRICHSYPI